MSEDTNNYNKQNELFSESGQASLFDLSSPGTKKVEVRFSMEETSSDGGFLLLNEADKYSKQRQGLNTLLNFTANGILRNALKYLKP